MSENDNKKLEGFVEYLSLLSDMMIRMKEISDKYGINPSKMNEDGTFDEIMANADPMVVGLLVTTIMKFKGVLDNPLDNIPGIDQTKIINFQNDVKKIKEAILRGKSSE